MPAELVITCTTRLRVPLLQAPDRTRDAQVRWSPTSPPGPWGVTHT